MKAINFLIKPASSLCNLRCRYCFYEDESENRMQKCMGVMKQETVDVLLAESFSAIEPGGTITFAFQGGEPTVAGLPYFQYFTKKARELCPPRVRIYFSIQTNATLLDREWAEFFRRENFLVGISMDGTKDLHNFNRPDAKGHGTWNLVRRNMEMLQRTGVSINALCVVTAQCARSPEKVYNELKKLGFTYLQFIACLDPIGEPRGNQPFSLTPEAYGKFLCTLFDLWYDDWRRGQYHSIRLFDDYIHLCLGDAQSTCATCGKCGGYFVVEGDGSVYPCDFFALDDWRLGTLGEQTLPELAKSPKMIEFLTWGTEKPAECLSCPYRRLCNGGCKNDWTTGPDGPHNYYCSSFRRLFDHAAPRMMEIADAERAARRR